MSQLAMPACSHRVLFGFVVLSNRVMMLSFMVVVRGGMMVGSRVVMVLGSGMLG